ncbi:MAG: single-stranded DNA-binding protein [Bacteroidales bacterium]
MSVNKVILIGNVGKEPEIRYLEGGVAVASFPLATTERGYKTQAGVQVPERTEWHNVIAWRGLAEIVEKYVHKGSPLFIEGKIRTRSWDDQNGVKRYTTEIYAENIELLGRRPEGSATGNFAPANPGVTQAPAQPQPFQNPAQPQADQALNNQADDLPF